jgi:undecaprenyl-diphosphatase
VGGVAGQVPLVLLGAAWLSRRRRRWGVALPVVMAGAGLLQLAAKWTVDRPRPNVDPWGYPSAHTLSLVVLLGYLAYVGALSSSGRLRRELGVGAAIGAVGLVAVGRMYLDVHWLSDVAGGVTGGLAYLCFSLALVQSGPELWRGLAGTQPTAVDAEQC